MTTETIERNEIAGYVCPSCRMVFSALRETNGNGVVCPGCNALLKFSSKNESVKEISIVETFGEDSSDIPSNEVYSTTPEELLSDIIEDDFGKQSGDINRDFSLKLIFPLIIFSIFVLGTVSYVIFRPARAISRDLVKSNTDLDNVTNNDDQENNSIESTVEVYSYDPEDEFQVERVKSFLSEWYGTKSIDEKLSLVKQTEGIKTKMERYYKWYPSPESELKTVSSAFDLTSAPGYACFTCLTEDYESRRGVLEYSEESILLDWESYVAYCEMTWAELAEKKPTKPVKLRVLASSGNYYNNNFSDEYKWRAVTLENPNEEDVIYGYVEHNSAIEHLMFNFGNANKQNLIIEAHFLPNEESGNQLIIKKVVQEGWLERKNQ